MNYYRKIETSINDLKYKMQIAALTLNTNKNKNDINEMGKKFDNYYNNEYIDNAISRTNRLINIFNTNLTNHIDDYKLNVPNNLKSDITNIKNEIGNLPENLNDNITNIKSDITNIKNKISNNLKFDITAIKNEIDNLPENLNDNMTNIKSDITTIKNEIPNNLKSDITTIKNEIDNLPENLNDKIAINKKNLDTHENIINANLARLDKIKYNIDDIYILELEQTKDLNFTSNIDKIEILNVLFNSTDFKAGGYIELFCQFLFKYPNYNTIGKFSLLFQFYDKNNNMFKEYTEIQTNSGDNNKELLDKKCFYVLRLLDNYDEIRLKIFVKRVDENDFENILIKMINTTNSNKLILKYIIYNIK